MSSVNVDENRNYIEDDNDSILDNGIPVLQDDLEEEECKQDILEEKETPGGPETSKNDKKNENSVKNIINTSKNNNSNVSSGSSINKNKQQQQSNANKINNSKTNKTININSKQKKLRDKSKIGKHNNSLQTINGAWMWHPKLELCEWKKLSLSLVSAKKV